MTISWAVEGKNFSMEKKGGGEVGEKKVADTENSTKRTINTCINSDLERGIL